MRTLGPVNGLDLHVGHQKAAEPSRGSRRLGRNGGTGGGSEAEQGVARWMRAGVVGERTELSKKAGADIRGSIPMAIREHGRDGPTDSGDSLR